MLSLPYGFSSSVRRSGHAACWCPPLDGIVQFGGWPPSEELSRTIQQDGTNCPLYLLRAKDIVRGIERAEQEKQNPSSPTAVEVVDGTATNAQRAPETRRTTHQLEGDGLGDHLAGHPAKPKRPVWMLAAAGPSSPSHPSLSQKDADPNESGSHANREGEPYGDRGVDVDSADAESIRYDEGYQSEPSDFSAGPPEDNADDNNDQSATSRHGSSASSSSSSSSFSASSSSARLTAGTDRVVAPVITMDLLRALGSNLSAEASLPPRLTEGVDEDPTALTEGPPSSPPISFHDAASTNTTTTASNLPSVLLASRRALGVGDQFREAPPILSDITPIPGKLNTRPLRWRSLREFIAPRTRHGHHLVYADNALYVMGGSYWAQGGALATTDMSYDLATHSWHQLSSLFPPRFCATLAESNCTALPASSPSSPPSAVRKPQKVLYYFGGSDYTQQLTATLFRLWLPDAALQELPQYGATPRKQFKGTMVCDVQMEQPVEALRRGEVSLGRLFYMDGFQDGRPMAPALRYYTLATGFWVKVCSCPDLVRAQVAGVWYTKEAPLDGKRKHLSERQVGVLKERPESVAAEVPMGVADEAPAEGQPQFLARFDVFGGMPSRRGKQRRSRVCYSFDAARQTYDYAHPFPVPGLTAHTIVSLPPPPVPPMQRSSSSHAGTLESSENKTESVWLQRLRDEYGVSSISCGGNEDLNNREQNSLGEPVSWVYLLGRRDIPLSEQVRTYIDTRRIPYKIMLAPKKDELLDELF